MRAALFTNSKNYGDIGKWINYRITIYVDLFLLGDGKRKQMKKNQLTIKAQLKFVGTAPRFRSIFVQF
jgi:hypothetical protein